MHYRLGRKLSITHRNPGRKQEIAASQQPPSTVKTLNIGTPRPATVVVLNIKQFYLMMK